MDPNDNIEQIKGLIGGIKTDATSYFTKTKAELPDANSGIWWTQRFQSGRDQFWSALPPELQSEAKRLDQRLVSVMGQIAPFVRNAPLASEADQRDVMISTKAMRSALLLRRFRAWDAEILHDEGTVLGVTHAGQSDDEPANPEEAGRAFGDAADKVAGILDLVAASPGFAAAGEQETSETTRYRRGTAFIMMWMDNSKPELIDVSDAVKDVFAQFDIRALRADDIEHEGLITPRILNEIQTAEFCFADLSGERPNVYYEVGYAHALGRRVILYHRAGTGLHFDLAGYNCPEYQNLHDLKDKLTARLRALTNKEPKAT